MSAAAPALARSILVVEDEASIAQAVATRLRSEGFAVTIAPDGPSGVERCRTPPARPRRARPHAAGARRPRRVPRDPAGPAGSGADADRARFGDRPRRRAGRRRRRLPHQAVQQPRAGRPGPRAAAAGRAPTRRRRRARRRGGDGRGHDRPRIATRAARRRPRAPHAHRVRPARPPRGARRRASSPGSSCSPTCGATTTGPARAPSIPTCGRSDASSATTSCGRCTVSGTRRATHPTRTSRRDAPRTARAPARRRPLHQAEARLRHRRRGGGDGVRVLGRSSRSACGRR